MELLQQRYGSLQVKLWMLTEKQKLTIATVADEAPLTTLHSVDRMSHKILRLLACRHLILSVPGLFICYCRVIQPVRACNICATGMLAFIPVTVKPDHAHAVNRSLLLVLSCTRIMPFVVPHFDLQYNIFELRNELQ